MYHTGSRDFFWYGNSSQPSTENYASGFDSASTSEYTQSSQSSSTGASPHWHWSSEPQSDRHTYPGTTDGFSIPETTSSTSRRSFKANEYFHNRTDRDNERRPRRSKKRRSQSNDQLKSKAKKLDECRLQLFHCRKDLMDYTGAEKSYQEIMEGRDPTESEDLLNLNHSFAAMLVIQGKFQDAEPISMTVWEKRKQYPDPPSDVFKESHRQLCSILCALGKHKDAETMQRSMYRPGTMDAWALENGDEVCQRLREQRDFKKAKDIQVEVWQTRLNHNGPRDDVIESGLRLIGDLEELVAAVDIQYGSELERRRSISYKETLECEIELALQKIWDPRPQPELTTSILDAGHKLGMIVFRQDRFPDAEAIFTPVWEGKKRHGQFGDTSTTTTGSMLGKTLCRQGKEETYRRAVDILPNIWQTMMRNRDPEAVSTGEDLAQAYYSTSQWPNAEHVYRWISQHKRQNHYPTGEIEDADWSLSQTLYNQGTNKYWQAHMILDRLYQQWYASFPDSSKTLDCGYMLAQLLSRQPGKAEEARKVALDVFNGRGASMEKGAAYVDSGHLYGSLLEKDGKLERAESILDSVWKDQAVVTEEQKGRLSCGQLLGQILIKRRKYSDAKKILESVLEAQQAASAGILDLSETRRLLKKLKKEREKGKRNSGWLGVTTGKKR